jgi:hypothetical protein
MAMRKEEVEAWLKTIPPETWIAIDDGGLSLVVVDNQDVYIEVGGLPEEEGNG